MQRNAQNTVNVKANFFISFDIAIIVLYCTNVELKLELVLELHINAGMAWRSGEFWNEFMKRCIGKEAIFTHGKRNGILLNIFTRIPG